VVPPSFLFDLQRCGTLLQSELSSVGRLLGMCPAVPHLTGGPVLAFFVVREFPLRSLGSLHPFHTSRAVCALVRCRSLDSTLDLNRRSVTDHPAPKLDVIMKMELREIREKRLKLLDLFTV
jgi:hypothetical protein